MSNKNSLSTRTMIVLVAAAFLLALMSFFGSHIFSGKDVLFQTCAAILGVILSAVVTIFLLNGQTANEEYKDRNMKVFEKKQEVYQSFLERLNEITRDGEISIQTQRPDGSTADELKDLIFQLGYVQMLASQKTVSVIYDALQELLTDMDDYAKKNFEERQNEAKAHYNKYANCLHTITEALRCDLNNETASGKNPYQEKMRGLLQNNNLYVANNDRSDAGLQNWFWKKLQAAIEDAGLQVDSVPQDIEIQKYESDPKPLSIRVNINPQGEPLFFSARLSTVGNYYLAVERPQGKRRPELEAAILHIEGFKADRNWLAVKDIPITHYVNFMEKSGAGYEALRSPQRAQQMMNEIAQETLNAIHDIQQSIS